MKNENAKHTPGPWGVTRLNGVEYVTIDGGRVSVARVSALKGGEGNARLIAAAPEMAEKIERLEAEKKELLAALEMIANKISPDSTRSIKDCGEFGVYLRIEGINKIRAAIARAKGESK